MKKILLALLAIATFISCSESPEEKANKLIKEELKKSLYLPESYSPVETKVDSAFSPYSDPEVFNKLIEINKMNEKLEELDEKMKDSEKNMAIWSGPYHSAFGKHSYNEAKEEYDEAKSEFEALQEKGVAKMIDVMKSISEEPKFIGFTAFHNYRANNNSGQTLIGNQVFLIDDKFEKVLYSFELSDYNDFQKVLKQFKEQIPEYQQYMDSLSHE